MFSPYAEQRPVFAILQRALARDRIHHAFLFEGPPGTGKSFFALKWAQALNCEQGKFPPCENCTACQKIQAGTHPDIVHFDLTAKGLTERVRALGGMLAYAPHEGRMRVVLLDPAEEIMGAQNRGEAANALLKILEEPPHHTLFVLCTSAGRLLPVTVRSRCVRVAFPPLGTAEVERWLRDEKNCSAVEAKSIAARSQGGLTTPADGDSETEGGRVLASAQASDFLSAAAQATPGGLARPAVLEQIAESREQSEMVLSELLVQLRDHIVDQTQVAAQAPAVTTPQLLRAFHNVRRASNALRGNAAPLLLIESLYFQLFGEFPEKPSYRIES